MQVSCPDSFYLAIEMKTQISYVDRTLTFLKDLYLVVQNTDARSSTYSLTDSGESLIQALKSEGYLTTENRCHLPPSYEALYRRSVGC